MFMIVIDSVWYAYICLNDIILWYILKYIRLFVINLKTYLQQDLVCSRLYRKSHTYTLISDKNVVWGF